MSDYVVPDLLQPNLKLVLCGTAPSKISAREKAYYANPANKFWRTLYVVGLTPEQLSPKEYPRLLSFGIGLTDMAKHAIGNDSDLSASDFDREAFVAKIRHYQPRYLAFTSKKSGSVYFQCATGNLHYGLQGEGIDGTQLFVLPSTSGLATSYWDESYWHELANLVRKMS